MGFTSILEKSILHGAVSSVGAIVVGGYKTQLILPFTEKMVPLWIAGGLVGIFTSAVNDVVHSYVLPEIPVNKKVKSESAIVLGVGLSSLIFVSSLYALNPALPKEFGFINSLAVGAISEVVTGYALDIIR